MEKEEFYAILKKEVIGEGNNALASVNISRNTEKKYRSMSQGVKVIVDVKSESRLKAFCNIRNQIACVSALRVVFRTVNPKLFFSCDDVSILINKMDAAKPTVITTKTAMEFLNQ